LLSIPDETEGSLECPDITMITTNILTRTIQTQITGVRVLEECTAEALGEVVEHTAEEEDILLLILDSREEVTTTLGEEEEGQDITTDMEREEGNTTTMMTRDNFHSEQEKEDTPVHHPASSLDRPRLTAILRTVTMGDINGASGDTEITGKTTARTLTTTGTATIRGSQRRVRKTNLPERRPLHRISLKKTEGKVVRELKKKMKK